MTNILTILIAILFIEKLFSQTIILPIVNVKSHKTFTIEKIEFSENQTIFFFSIENQKTEGEAWFCADEKIYIKNTNGTEKYFITKTDGIPTCPKKYIFKKTGEILQFKLFFPKIPTTIKEIDIVENCSDNCFYFNGVIVDEIQNEEIKLYEKGVTLYSDKKLEEALQCFNELIKTLNDEKSYIFSFSLYIIPLIYFEKGDKENAKKEYSKLINSSITDKNSFIEKLNKVEFFEKLK